MIGQAFHWANLTVAFLLELCALAALGYWGFRTASGPAAKAALGIGAPLLAAVLWGLFAAPGCRSRSPAGGCSCWSSARPRQRCTPPAGTRLPFAVLVVANVVLVTL
ncbi:MAG TPA: YrdB family protein [Actinomycetota bacterium]|nr:YrdB family protein [Actinomycetota bacterium]